MTPESDQKFHLPPRQELIAFGVLTITLLLIRINNISADAPMDLSTSQGIYTDPAQYISYARNMVLWGNFNPLHDYRLIFFLKSTTTAVSYIIFKLFGVGYVQSNMVGFIFSFSTIILLYFAMRRIAGNIAALFFLIFISLDFNQIFYGRMPFLENSLNFFAIFSLTVLVYAKRIYAFVIAGLLLGLGIFFGKIIGLIYLFPFTCFALWEYFYLSEERKDCIKRYASFLIGFLFVLTALYLFSYRPMSSSVEGYISEQAFSLYGAPEAFKDLSTFIYKYASFGVSSRLFERMVVPALLAWGMILIICFRVGFKKSWKNKLFGITPGIIFLIALVIGAYASLMIWNYRPLRYQTMLIYPIHALAAVFVSTIVHGEKTGLDRRGNGLFMALLFVFILLPIYKLMGPIYNLKDMPFHFYEARTILFIVAIFITAAVIAYMKLAPRKFIFPPRWFKSSFIIMAVLFTLIPGTVKYLKWVNAATFTTTVNSKDLATIISPEAVVSGPYAAYFTQDNQLMNLIHMFGVSKVDSVLFRRYPVTHLLLDKSNKELAQKHYPEIMKNATAVVRYDIGGRPVNLYRIAGLTGNIEATAYNLSAYELAQYYYIQNDIARGHEFMKHHIIKYPNNRSANHTSAVLSNDNGFYDEAEYYYKKVIEYSPTDFYLRFKAGEFYINMYNRTGNMKYKTEAIAQFKMAKKYNTLSKKLGRDIDKLLMGGKPAGNK